MTQTPLQDSASSAAASPAPAAPPVAKKVPHERTHHGDTFVDNYEWLREKDSPEVVEHLKAENAYQEAVTAHQEPLREAIFQEIKGRTQETDLSVPNRKDGWWYFSRSVEGKEYGIQCRVPWEPVRDHRRFQGDHGSSMFEGDVNGGGDDQWHKTGSLAGEGTRPLMACATRS